MQQDLGNMAICAEHSVIHSVPYLQFPSVLGPQHLPVMIYFILIKYILLVQCE